jgi:RNA polymerase sigma-70 factor (ECF subfamily)
VQVSVTQQEKDWVKGLLDGREEIFRAVYDAYQRPVFSFAFFLTRSKDTAEEVVQEVFIRLWEHRTKLDEETFLLAYLKKMTQNLIIDLFRKANRDKDLQARIFAGMKEADSYTTDRILEKEFSLIYQQALDALPPRQRIVFALSRDENLTYQEIALRLRLSRHTIRNHMAEAIHSIREHVRQNADLATLAVIFLLRDLK